MRCPWSFTQIAGDAAERLFLPFANPGRNRVPQTVSFGQAALPLDRTTTVSPVSKKHRSFRRSTADEGTVDFRLSPLPPVCFRLKG